MFFTGEAVATLTGAVVGPALAGATTLPLALNAASARTLGAAGLGYLLLPRAAGPVPGPLTTPDG